MPNETLLKAISWTLVHSVWQGVILAVLAGLVILFTKKATSALRYNLLAGLFVAFMVAVGFTCNYEFQEEGRETITRLNLPITIQNQEASPSIPEAGIDFSAQIIDFLNANSSAIVMIWFLIFSIKCLNIFSNLNHVYRIRNYRTQTPSEYWNDRVLELSSTLNIKKHIVLLESQLVKVPSVTGFFKPIILIPVGLLSNLPQDQIEAILLHELAHIRRKDYFINLIQSFAEIIFFFNPGVLWLSSLLKEERENCCDDIAVQVTKSKSKFINALVSFQEYNMKQNELAMGFGGRKNQLLERAKRIIYDDNKTLNSIEKTFLSICLIIVTAFMFACSNTKPAVANVETLPPAPISFDYTEPANDGEVIAYKEALSEAEVNEITAKSEEQISDETAKMADELEIAEEYKSAVEEKAEATAEIEGSKALKFDREQLRLQANKARLIADIHKSQAEKARLEAEVKMLEQKVEKAKSKTQYLNKDQNRNQNRDENRNQNRNENKTEKKVSTYIKQTDTEEDGKSMRNRIHVIADVIPKNIDGVSKNIIEVLIAENVISDVKNLSYKLSANNLIVNDKEISKKIHDKLKEYLKPGISNIYYNFEVNTKQ